MHTDGNCGGNVRAGGGFFALQTFRKAAEKQGKNNAGVTSRSAEESACGNLADFPNGNVVRQLGKSFCTVADGHGHIRAGVAVRNREDVKSIHLSFFVT